ncbi:GAF domain-containing protein [Alloalcanivorax gelatiniphagus]
MAPSLDAMRSELTAAMAGSQPGRSAADALCATSAGLCGVDGAAVSVVIDGMMSGTFGSSSEASRRMDEHQFTFGEGPCLDAITSLAPVLAPDLASPDEQRWPLLRDAILADGVRGVFALPIMVTSVCVGALDLFRARPGPLEGDALAGAMLAAELASEPLVDLIAASRTADRDEATFADIVGAQSDGEMHRVEVYQATGILISALDVDADEALLRLRAHAIATGQTASQVARAVIERRLVLDRDGDRGRDRPPPPGDGPGTTGGDQR